MTTRLLLFPSLTLCALLFDGCTANEAIPNPGTQTTSSAPATNALSPQGSTNFTSKDANFAIYFPSQVQQTKKNESSQWGEYQTFTFLSKTATASYAIVATTIPSGVDTSDSAKFIDGLQTGFLKGSAPPSKKAAMSH